MKIDLTISDIYTIQDALADTPYRDARPIMERLEALLPKPEVSATKIANHEYIKLDDIKVADKAKIKPKPYLKVSKRIADVLDKLDPLPDVKGLKQVFPELSDKTLEMQLYRYKRVKKAEAEAKNQ